MRRAGFSQGDACDLTGGYIPFAITKALRQAGDTRLSLEERYGSTAGYVNAVTTAVNKLVSERLAHLRFWYMNVQPTYLVVYVGSADQFLAIDIKEWVRQNYGDKILTLNKNTTTVKVSKKNKLDEHLFHLIMERNLVPSLRAVLAQEDDSQIRRFLRDSSIVKWLVLSKAVGAECRLMVVKYMSKMRTEAYFESRVANGEWKNMRSHWEFAMGSIVTAYPFLSFEPKRKVIERERVEIDDYDDEVVERVVTDFCFADTDDDDLFDEARTLILIA